MSFISTRVSRGCAVLAVILGTATGSIAQISLTTTYLGNCSVYGCAFDIEATGGVPLLLESFDLNTGPGAAVIFVRANGGSHQGFETDPTAWTNLLSGHFVSARSGVPTPLNLSLQYPVMPGARLGVYVFVGSVLPFMLSTFSTSVGQPVAQDNFLTIYGGVGATATPSGHPFGPVLGPRIFNGTLYYRLMEADLSITQSGPGIGDLDVRLLGVAPTATQGFTLVSANTGVPQGQGGFFGITPDATTWWLLSVPYFPGNPFHFRTADIGVFPDAPLLLGPGAVSSLSGTTLDFVCLLLRPGFVFDSTSDVERVTFQ